MKFKLAHANSQSALEAAGQAANQAATLNIFEEYQQRKSANTLRRQKADLDLLIRFLHEFNVEPESDLMNDPESWRGASWGLVEAFRRWQLDQGYAIESINVRLSTIKTYAGLAHKAGIIPLEEYALIRMVSGYSHRESMHVDEKRVTSGLATRRGYKKAEPINLSADAVYALKHDHPETPQGRRDALLMCLLLDHGLRCNEIVRLKVGDFDLAGGTFTFYRPKVDKVQTHALSKDTHRALAAYIKWGDCPEEAAAPLLRASNKSGRLTKSGISLRGVTNRVNELGQMLGIPNLSTHDGRHSWATRAARSGTDPFALQEAGGWSSLSEVRRYIKNAEIANEGVKLE
jgi:integrase